jgi:hypothetical protein
MMIITFSDIINDGMMIDRTRVFLRLAAKKALYIYIYIYKEMYQIDSSLSLDRSRGPFSLSSGRA